MLTLLGCCSLIQCLFLPGFIVTRWLDIRGALRTITTSFALSLIINAFLVAALVLLHAYSRWALAAIFVAECLLAYRLCVRESQDVTPMGRSAAPWNALELIALTFVLVLTAEYVGWTVRGFGSIFSGWDDIVSWNRWAMDWYRGTLPRHTWHYPQLLPEAWSLTYAFMGTDRVQFFARGMMGLFGLAAIAVLVDLARSPARLAFLASAWFTGMFLRRFNNVTAGLADVPVSFFALAAIAESLRPGDGRIEGARLRSYVGPVLAAGAALTKQAGLYIAVIYPLLSWALNRSEGRRLRTVASSYAIIAALVLPWYVYKELEIRSGGETSEIHYVTHDIYHGLSLSERLVEAAAKLSTIAGGPAILTAIAALILLGLLDRRARWIFALVGAPYMLIWSLWFSYDVRNASLGLAPCAIVCGAGLAILAGRLPLPARAFRRPAWMHSRSLHAARLLPIVALALVVLAFVIHDSDLIARQDRKQRGIGNRAFNSALYAYRADSGLAGRILVSDQYLLAYTPGWDSNFVITRFGDASAFVKDAARAEVGHLIVSRRQEPEIASILEDWERSGRFTQTFQAGEYAFWTRAGRGGRDAPNERPAGSGVGTLQGAR